MKTLLCILLLAASTQAQQPNTVAVTLERADIIRWLGGECVPRFNLVLHPKDGVLVILEQGGNASSITKSFILALGIIPRSRVIELDEPLPEGFQHIDIIEHHNSHPPFRTQRLVGATIRPVEFCK